MPQAEEPPFEPKIASRPPDAYLAHVRRRTQPVYHEMDEAIQPLIDLHLSVCETAVDALTELHKRLVDETDIDLNAQTRWTAAWEATGRSIAFAYAVIDQLKAGHTIQLAGTIRALHESLNLAIAVATDDEARVRRWLDGKQYKPKELSTARHRFYAEIANRMSEQGDPLEGMPGYEVLTADLAKLGIDATGGPSEALRQLDGRVYGYLSDAAHGRRDGSIEALAPNLRQYAYRRHPDARIRAAFVDQAESTIEQAVRDIGLTLGHLFVGFDGMRAALLHYIESFEEVRKSHPIAEAD